MKNTLYAISVLIFSSINIFSQPFFEDVLINPFWSFYCENYLDAASSGKGFTGTAGTGSISSINHNPASMEIPRRYQAGIQYTYKTDQSWLQFTGLEDMYLSQNLFSGSAGFGLRINKYFQTGFLYSNPASFTLNLGTIIKTNEFGQQIGSYDAYEKYVVHSFSVPVVYNIEKLRIGAVLNYSLHRTNINFDDSEYVGKFDKFNVQGGIIVIPVKGLSIGMTFVPEVSGTVSNSWPSVAGDQDSKAIMPMKLGAGVEYTLKGDFLRISVDYNYTNLSARNNLKDRHQAHLGLEYFVNKNWIVRTGFFTFSDPRDLNRSWINPQDNYDQIFLTFGASFKIKEFEASLALMDSHISSGMIKNTFINAGLTFNF